MACYGGFTSVSVYHHKNKLFSDPILSRHGERKLKYELITLVVDSCLVLVLYLIDVVEERINVVNSEWMCSVGT